MTLEWVATSLQFELLFNNGHTSLSYMCQVLLMPTPSADWVLRVSL